MSFGSILMVYGDRKIVIFADNQYYLCRRDVGCKVGGSEKVRLNMGMVPKGQLDSE